LLAEVAAINDAARDRKTPALRLHRKFLGREHVPHDIRPPEVRIAAIALVVRQAELPRRKVTRRRDVFEPTAQLRRRRGTIDHTLNRLTFRQDLHLAGESLQVVTTRQRIERDKQDKETK